MSVAVGGAAVGLAYGCWTHGVLYGNITLLSVASFFIPVMTCAFGVVRLDAHLTDNFWLGSAALVAGSVLCWYSSKK